MRLLALEEFVVEFSSRFANTPVPEIGEEIKRALAKIGECLDFNRCSLWELSEDKAIMVFQYAVPGAKDATGVNYNDFPWTVKKMMEGNNTCYHSIDELPDEAKRDKETFQRLEIKSFMSLPYYIGGKPVAILTADSVKHEMQCTPDYIVRLKLLGEIITSAFYRKKMEERYKRSVIEAQRLDESIKPGDFPLREETKNECKYEGIIGDSPMMKLVFSRMEQVAPTDSVILITGETGTGKGVIANAIHDLSNRSDKRKVVVNCAALTPNLIESELFGREKGAYTGATEMQIVRFELADKGTLILDEITELPMDLQAKLLRAIQDGEFERLGSPRTIKVNVRILALTSRNIKEEVLKGRFRRDLYYRLNVFPITMPPLRDHREDIPLLAQYFVQQFNRKMQKEIKSIPKEVMAELTAYPWPGNIRELEHVIERASIVCDGRQLHLAEKLTACGMVDAEEDAVTNLAEMEKNHIVKILKKTSWRIEGPKGAAILLGLHPNTLRGRMQKLGIYAQKS